MVTVLAVAGMCAPQLAMAAEAPGGQPAIGDVQLHEGGVLVGQVVSPENIPLSGAQVVLLSDQQQLAVACTDGNGYFSFTRLPGGRLYRVAAGNAVTACRAWAGPAAPPSARPGVLLVSNPQSLRGQNCGCGDVGCAGGCGGGGGPCMAMRNFLANPIVVAGIVATAVAVPVAIHNSDRGSASP